MGSLRVGLLLALLGASTGFRRAPAPRRALLPQAHTSEELATWRVKEIKAELRRLGSPRVDSIFEKDELIQELSRMYDIGGRGNADASASGGGAEVEDAQDKPWRRLGEGADVTLALRGAELKETLVRDVGGESNFRPESMTYLVVECGCRSKGMPKALSLIFDTACSGILLRPQSVRKLGLPAVDAGGTMTSVGGTGSVPVTMLEGLHMKCSRDASVKTPELPYVQAAIQDIGALPDDVDGILGMQALSLYAGIDLDIKNQKLSVFRSSLPELASKGPLGSNPTAPFKAPFRLCKLQVPFVDMNINGKGPIRLLLDSGASTTIINWKAARENFGLSPSSALGGEHGFRLNPHSGAMGADGRAISLSHQLRAKTIALGDTQLGFAAGSGVELGILVDIGDLPVIDTLASEGIVGVLGLNVLEAAFDGLSLDFRNLNVEYHPSDRMTRA